MIASLLLITCLVELVCTVWCLARLKGFVGRLDALESVVDRQAKVLADMSGVGPAAVAVSDAPMSTPTPEELQQAQQILAALGLSNVDGVKDE